VSEFFAAGDLRQIERLGIARKEAERQIGQLIDPPPFAVIDRPCVINDGISVIQSDDHSRMIALYQDAANQSRLTKFVPASGAATRMFHHLLSISNESPPPDRRALVKRSKDGEEAASCAVLFLDHLDKFAFSPSLYALLTDSGIDVSQLQDGAEIKKLLQLLLYDDHRGLGFSTLPKGLIPFHINQKVASTALDEHIAEAVAYARDRDGVCRLHLTVAESFLTIWQETVAKAKVRWRESAGVDLSIQFSVQSKATDTIALTGDNQPFRLPDGSILFRPGGHGALIYNLEQLEGDIILIKNIDNVAPEHRRADTVLWKQLLTGYLLDRQSKSFAIQESLSDGDVTAESLDSALQFLEDDFGVSLAPGIVRATADEKAAYIKNTLDRPMRVCGVVRNDGEPGGGPFWVRTESGVTRQIVESSQINTSNPEQAAHIFEATHFNPVDLVLGVRDRNGKPYPLLDYVDYETSFVSRKSQGGRTLKALEHPGLWNGAMALWNTLFVEVPLSTFSPVKTIIDLLRIEHQPEADL